MFKRYHSYGHAYGLNLILTPFELAKIIGEWNSLRGKMIRSMPEDFEREEWAYVMTFLGSSNLNRILDQTFGPQVEGEVYSNIRLHRPRGPVAVWLPNNVSLLGPLLVILISLTGNRILIKAGSRSKNLTSSFIDYALHNLSSGDLTAYLEQMIRIAYFDHDDVRNSEMSGEASVRIFFGSDQAAKDIQALPHSIMTVDFFFTDKQSELWLEPDSVDDETIENLIKVFAVYGQAGCTSPRCVYLIDGNELQAIELRERIVETWSSVFKGIPPQHIASSVTMATQLAKTYGWDVAVVPNRGAAIATGDSVCKTPDANMLLPITWIRLEDRIKAIPENIQTIGHSSPDQSLDKWLQVLEKTNVKRFVPLGEMHHFGPTWDGFGFWRQLFEEVDMRIQS